MDRVEVCTPEFLRQACEEALVNLGLIAAALLAKAESGDFEARKALLKTFCQRYEIYQFAREHRLAVGEAPYENEE